MWDNIEALIESTSSVVQVSSAAGSAGQALTATPNASIELVAGRAGPVEYKVGADPWALLDREQGIALSIDLASTAVLVRKVTPAAAAVPLTVKVNKVTRTMAGASNLPLVVVGTAPPSNSDGMPDGTLYIQTA